MPILVRQVLVESVPSRTWYDMGSVSYSVYFGGTCPFPKHGVSFLPLQQAPLPISNGCFPILGFLHGCFQILEQYYLDNALQ